MDKGARFQSKERKPPLYSPPTLGGDKKLNIIRLTPPPSEGCDRGEVGGVRSKAPMFEPIASLFSIKALPFGEGLGGVRGIEVLFAPIVAMFRSSEPMFEDNAALFEVNAAMFCFIDALVGVIDALVGVIDALV